MIEITQRQEGAIWSKVRSLIDGMPAIEKAMAATRYEEASAHWDDAARQITKHVVDVLVNPSSTSQKGE